MTAVKTVAQPRGAAARLPLRPIRLSPPPLRTADGHHLDQRRASWTELFFDLVIAGAVNQLAGTLQDHPDPGTLARSVFFFVPVWWLWVQFSFYADRHESDDAAHRSTFLAAIVLAAGLAASASRAVTGDPAGFVVAFAALRGLLLLLYARARRALPATRPLYGRYLACFGLGGALWAASIPVGGTPRFAIWTAALAVDAAGALGMLAPRRHVPLNPSHLAERFQLFVLIVLGESAARLISAAAQRPWSVPLAVVLTAAVVTLAALWLAWNKTADHRALHRPGPIAAFAAANLPIVAGAAAASAGLHAAILAADRVTPIGIGPRAALYGGVSVSLLASACLPSSTMTRPARAARLATSAAAMGLVFMGAIVIPVYLVPALALTLALGLAAESPWPRHRHPAPAGHPQHTPNLDRHTAAVRPHPGAAPHPCATPLAPPPSTATRLASCPPRSPSGRNGKATPTSACGPGPAGPPPRLSSQSASFPAPGRPPGRPAGGGREPARRVRRARHSKPGRPPRGQCGLPGDCRRDIVLGADLDLAGPGMLGNRQPQRERARAVIGVEAMLAVALHLCGQELSLRDIAARLVITRGKKKGQHPSPATVLRMLCDHDEKAAAAAGG